VGTSTLVQWRTNGGWGDKSPKGQKNNNKELSFEMVRMKNIQ